MACSSTTSTAKSWLAAAAAPVRQERKKGLLVFHCAWTLSYMRRTSGNRCDAYSAALKHIAEVDTAEAFWEVYNHLARPHQVPASTDYFLFRKGVRPMWEDDANKGGGRWTIRVHKSLTPKAYEDLALAAVGEQFDTDDVLGIACSVRFQDDVLAIWVADATNKEALNSILNTARRVLELPNNRLVREWEFKPHSNSK